MNKWTKWMCACLLAGTTAWGQEAKPSQESATPSPQKVGDEADLLLQQGIVYVDLDNDPIGSGLGSILALRKIPFEASKVAGEKRVTVMIGTDGQQGNASVSEVLRLASAKSGCAYRVVNGKIRLATIEEWAAYDAGKAEFEAWTPKAAAPKSAELEQAERQQQEAELAKDAEQVKVVRDGAATKYEFMGKTWPEDDFKMDMPALYEKVKARDLAAGSGQPAPAKVGVEAKQLLDTKITLSVKDMGIGLAFDWACKISAPNLPIDVSKAANERKITFQLEEAVLATVLRQITQQTGAVYRHVNGRIQIVTPEEKTALDAGKAVFVPWEEAATPKPPAAIAEKSAESAPTANEKVGDEAALLLRRVSLELVDTPLAEAMEFMGTFAKVKILVSKGAGAKPVSLKLKNTTLGEAVRQIKDQAGAVHRVEKGELRLAVPDEWADIDAGKGTFEKYQAK